MRLVGTYVETKFACRVKMRLSDICTEASFYNVNNDGTEEIYSAYIKEGNEEFCKINTVAKEYVDLIMKNKGVFKSKGCIQVPSKIGTLTCNEKKITKQKLTKISDKTEVTDEVLIQMFGQIKNITDVVINSNAIKLEIHFETNDARIFNDRNGFVKLASKSSDASRGEDDIVIRSVEEIALTKHDVTWLKSKKYYVITDDRQAEALFGYYENFNGKIAYDTETTGVRINCYGKRNSSYERRLQEYNESHPDEQKRADKLVGIIFCSEENVSYYFPCGNRKFRNLYQDGDIRKQVIGNIKARYTVGDLSGVNGDEDMRNYILTHSEEDFDTDIILMERVRNILEKCNLLTWNGTFEYKVGLMYGIDTHVVGDGQVLYKLLFKFSDSESGKKDESAKLKVRTYKELGVETWELEDFFPAFSDDETGKSSSKSKVDFSYMSYDGTKIYAPADGDFTFVLTNKYEAYMRKNHPKMEYIYNVEVQVACAGGYVEFYGIRIDEDKIYEGKVRAQADVALYEHEMRKIIGYNGQDENNAADELYNELKGKDIKNIDELTQKLYKVIEEDELHAINWSSNKQIAELFYDRLNIELPAGRRSVDKAAREFMETHYIDNEGKPKYPIIDLFGKYTKKGTLLKLFFNKLPEYMYPGGLIFPSFNLIGTDTGRMSCTKPNMQQTCKEISSITVPREGFIMVDSDYSQIEQRIMVGIAKQQSIVDLFKDPKTDFHTLVASMMFGVAYTAVTKTMRKQAKGVGFGTLYGMGDKSRAIKVCGDASPESIKIAKERQRAYFDMMPMVEDHIKEVKEYALVYNIIETLFHRFRAFNFYDSEGKLNTAKRAAILRQAVNAEIQGSAADIFKIGLVRMFYVIRRYKLFGKLLMVNMVHDEILGEIDTRYLNPVKAVVLLSEAMCFDIDGFPPLYTGAGVSTDWAHAKDKMAEMSPLLIDELTKKTKDEDIWLNPEHTRETDKSAEVVKWFVDTNRDFRARDIINCINNTPKGHVVHPEVVSILNLQFNYGRGDDCKSYNKKNGTKLTEDDFFRLNLTDFIKEFNLDWNPEDYLVTEPIIEEEEAEYDDSESEDGDYTSEDYENMKGSFQVIENDEIAGVDLRTLTKEFGCIIVNKDRTCRIDVGNRSTSELNALSDIVNANIADVEDEDAYKLYLLDNKLKWIDADAYVKGSIAEVI